jgi:serine/threonine protein kinase, bacterial
MCGLARASTMESYDLCVILMCFCNMSILLENRYQVIQRLDCGGFGETFLAEDNHMPSGRQCVIKQLKPNTSEPAVYKLIQERFQREAAILERLGSTQAQIPALYAFFESNQQFILVQEWIQGETLATKLQTQQTLSEETVTAILLSLLPVLAYVHQQQIVHRDIKPANIILRQTDTKPVLIDFGAVKEAMGTTLNSHGSTTNSIVVGTPGFMAPEQGVGRPVYSSDLYSLGLTAIHLLTGKAPQEHTLDPYTGELLWQSPSTSVSEPLARVLDRSVRYHPRDRYTTAAEMLADLESTARPLSLQSTVMPVAPVQPVTMPVVQPATIAVVQTTEPKPANLGKTILLGSVLAGGLIGGAIVLAANLKPSPSSSQDTEQTISQASTVVEQETPQSKPTTPNSPSVPQNESVSQAPIAQAEPPIPAAPVVQVSAPQARSLGWVRLGAVGNTSGFAAVGEPLIETTQPVTVAPIVVPEINAQIVTITGVNLRSDHPQPPNFRLAGKKSTLLANQRLKIINIKTFVDRTSPSPYTVVWAEVSLP